MTDTLQTELLELSADRANLTPQEVLNTLLCPEWDKARRMYDWRNHVSLEVQDIWPRLSQDARLAVFLQANVEAYDEEGWDPA